MVWGFAGLLGAAPAMFTPMMFDAPGSTESTVTVVTALAVLLFPLVCWGSATGLVVVRVLAKRSGYRRGLAVFLGLAPVLSGMAVVACFVVLSVFCGGAFTCG